MRLKLALILMGCLLLLPVSAQVFPPASGGDGAGIDTGTSLPETCTADDVFLRTGNTAAGLYLCTATDVWTGQGELTTVKVLTNDEIKALPTTPVEIIGAPGAGKIVNAVNAVMLIDTQAAEYTNIDAACALGLSIGVIDAVSYYIEADNGALGSMVVGGASVVPFFVPAVITASLGGYIGTASWQGQTGDMENLPLKLFAGNGGAGNFTGGHANNTLRVTVVYRVIPVS